MPRKDLSKQDAKVEQITDLDISFPADYEPNTINYQAKLVEKAIKERRSSMIEAFERKHRVQLNPREKSYGELADILATPNKIATLTNSYSTFKKLGGINLPEFLRKKQQKMDELESRLEHI